LSPSNEFLKKELGINGFIRFIQQFETGHGNYTLDRDEWQKGDIEKMVEEITKTKTAKQDCFRAVAKMIDNFTSSPA
jgi:hypothetical protein